MSSKIVITDIDPAEIVQKLHPFLSRSETDNRPVVLMTCGIAGAGKTTLSKQVLQAHPTFERLSIDENIASTHGLYNVDYKPELHEEYSEEAANLFQEQFDVLVARGKKDVVLDRAFYAKEDRDEFKAMVEKAGARWVLVHLKVDPELLWQRIGERRKKGMDANCALDISEELFAKYVSGFEHPKGEGEIVVDYGQ